MATTKGLYTTNRTYVGMLRGTFATVAYVVPAVYTTDPLFSFNSLLLPGETDYLPFNADNSLNNFNVNVLGDAKASNFSPYTGGYYSVLFDGTGDYISLTPNSSLTLDGDYTIEFSVYFTSLDTAERIPVNCWNTGSGWLLSTESSAWNFKSAGSFTLTYSTVAPAAGQWYHVAVTRSGSATNNVKLFVNGVQVAQGTNTSTLTPAASSTGCVIGGGQGGGGQLITGHISNLRIVKGTALYTAAFTPPTSPLTAISGTSLLTCQDNRFIDRSTNNFAITVSGDAKISAADPFEVPASFASYGGAYFDGTGDYLACGSQPLYAFGTGVFTVEAWIYVISRSAEYNFVATRTSAGSAASWSMSVVTSGGVTVYTDAHVFNNVGTVPLNAWTHVALVREGTSTNQTKVYINGINVASATNSQNFTTNTLAVGCASDGSQFPFLGYISDVRITKGTAVYTGNFTPPSTPVSISGSPIQYPNTANVNTSFPSANTSLSLLQYSQPHNNSTFLDKSNFRQVITRNGNSRQGTFSPYGANWSAYFDGTGDYLSAAYNSAFNVAGNTFTVEAWVNMTGAFATNSSSNKVGSIAVFGPATVGQGWEFIIDQTNNTFSLTVMGSNSNFMQCSFTFSLNTWYHVAAVRNGSTNYLFVNGVSQTLTTNAYTGGSAASGSLTIGTALRFAGYDHYFVGYISNFRLVSGTALYTSNFTPSTSPLTAVSGTSLLTCQSNRFIDNSTNNFTITLNGDTTIEKTSPFGLTANASPTFTGGSGYFDGSGDSLTSTGSTAFTMGTGSFTVEYWVYQTVDTGGYTQHVGSAVGSNGFAFGTAGLALYMTTASSGYNTSVAFALNTWNHIVWTRDSSGNVRAFLNGLMVYGPASITTNITETNFGIAQTVSGTGYNFTGYLSDIRVIKGMNTYTGNFTPPSAPLSLGGNSTIYSNTANVNTTFAGSNTTLMLNFTDAAIKDATTYFNLETVADTKLAFETAYSNVNYSNYFDGTGDYLSVPYNSALALGSGGTWTIEYWVYFNAAFGTFTPISHQQDATVRWCVEHAAASTLLLFDNSTSTTFTHPSTLGPNNWYHIAFVRDGTTVRMYVNGVASSTTTTSNLSNITSGPLSIGRNEFGGAYFFYMNGYIADVRLVKGTAIYNSTFAPSITPLTAVTNTSLLTCQSNRFIDNSTNNFAITVNGETAVRSFNPFQRNTGSSFYFDGTGDYLRIANNQSLALGTANFTIEFWANMTTNPSNQVILDQRPDGSHGAYPAILFESKYIRWYVSSATRIQSTSTLTLNTWYHVAICRVSGTTTMYINGNVSGATWADSTNYLTGAAGLVIGASTWSGGSANMNGYIDDLRITRGNARYTANFTPSITMLPVR
jgi:hypothetical protein